MRAKPFFRAKPEMVAIDLCQSAEMSTPWSTLWKRFFVAITDLPGSSSRHEGYVFGNLFRAAIRLLEELVDVSYPLRVRVKAALEGLQLLNSGFFVILELLLGKIGQQDAN